MEKEHAQGYAHNISPYYTKGYNIWKKKKKKGVVEGERNARSKMI